MTKTSGSILAAVALLASYGIASFGQADLPTVRADWTQPTYGTPVEHYVGVLESWQAGGDTTRIEWATADTTTYMDMTYPFGYTMRVKVAGVDSLGRQGPYSLWSNEWVDQGLPGAPSVPRLGLQMVER